jgi:hypothetical protein
MQCELRVSLSGSILKWENSRHAVGMLCLLVHQPISNTQLLLQTTATCLTPESNALRTSALMMYTWGQALQLAPPALLAAAAAAAVAAAAA